MAVILPKPNVPFLLERPDLVTPQWYEKLKQVADQAGGGGGGPSLVGASEAEAIAGTDDTKYSTPLRVADAIKGYEFATRSGGVARTIIDRSRDWVVAHDFSDGTGTPSNDLAALDAAVVAAGPSKGLLLTRPFSIPSTWTINKAGVKVQSGGEGVQITPTASMTSVVDITANFVSLEGLKFIGNGVATNAVSVSKGHTNQPTKIRDCQFWNIPRGVLVNYGSDAVWIDSNLFFTISGQGIRMNGANYESRIFGNWMIDIGTGMEFLISGGSLQAEGLKISHNTVLLYTTGIYLNGSYAFTIENNVIGNCLSGGVGINLNGSNQNNAHNIVNNFIGGDGYGNFGIAMTGTAVANIVMNNEISQWLQAPIACVGTTNDGTTIQNNRLRFNGGTPIQAGLVMNTCTRFLAMNNHISQVGGTSIFAVGTCTDSWVVFNVTYGASMNTGGATGVNIGVNNR